MDCSAVQVYSVEGVLFHNSITCIDNLIDFNLLLIGFEEQHHTGDSINCVLVLLGSA